MTFTQVIHGVLDHYSGDEAFERRYRKHMEKQNRKVLKDFWETIPTDLPEQTPQEVQTKPWATRQSRMTRWIARKNERGKDH